MHRTISLVTLFLTVTFGMRPNTGCVCIKDGKVIQMPWSYCAFNRPRPGHQGFFPWFNYRCRPYQDKCEYCREGWKRTCTKQCSCNFDLSLQHLYTDEAGRMGDGRNRSVLTYNGLLPGPPIVVCEGDIVTINLTNNLRNMQIDDSQTTLHLHGIPEMGDLVEFQWIYDHNVNKLSKTDWENCSNKTWNTKPEFGNYLWRAPNAPGIHYFACGRGVEEGSPGYHCKHGMKVAITVQEEPC